MPISDERRGTIAGKAAGPWRDVLVGLYRWLGGLAFVASLLNFAYFYLVTLGHAGPPVPRSTVVRQLAFNLVLFALFAVHHSVMARPGVKRWISGVLPARLERPTYVWMASALFFATCRFWLPLPGTLYRHTGSLATAHAVIQLAGVAVIVQAARRFDVWTFAGIRAADPVDRSPVWNRGPYRWVRHPVYLGWVLLTFGAAHMTASRLAFAAMSLAYLMAGLRWEERTLVASLGSAYEQYRRDVRWRLVPFVY